VGRYFKVVHASTLHTTAEAIRAADIGMNRSSLVTAEVCPWQSLWVACPDKAAT
jgi:hypothetical protein